MPPIVHSSIHNTIEQLRANLPHGLLVIGDPEDAMRIAKYLAGKDLADIIHPTDAKGVIDTQKGSVKVDQVRDMYKNTSGKSTQRRVFIIEHADAMTSGAQNAFLKLLEEPSEQTYFILTVRASSSILATIRSRVQTLHVPGLSSEQAAKLVKELGVTESRSAAQIIFLATGSASRMEFYAKDSESLRAKSIIVHDAKQLLQASTYQKISIIQKYASERDAALELLETARLLLKHSLKTAPDITTVKTLAKINDTYEHIVANGNTRLQLLGFVL